MPIGNGSPRNSSSFKKKKGSEMIDVIDEEEDKERIYQENAGKKKKAEPSLACLCHYRCGCNACFDSNNGCPKKMGKSKLDAAAKTEKDPCRNCLNNSPEKREEIRRNRANEIAYKIASKKQEAPA